MRLSWIKPSIWKVFLFFELCDVSLRTDKRVSPSMLAPLTWDDRMACVLKIPGSPISAAPATSTRAASDVWTAGATGAEKDMWMDQWKVITYHLYIFSIWDEHLFTSHFGDQRFIYSTSFCRFWSWKYIYKMSLKTYFGLVSSQVSTVVFSLQTRFSFPKEATSPGRRLPWQSNVPWCHWWDLLTLVSTTGSCRKAYVLGTYP